MSEVPAAEPPRHEHKDEGVTLILASVLGIFGLCGIGHVYLGMIKRGIIILFGNFILWGGAVLGFILTIETIIPIVMSVAALAFWVWSIFDARRLVREHNNRHYA